MNQEGRADWWRKKSLKERHKKAKETQVTEFSAQFCSRLWEDSVWDSLPLDSWIYENSSMKFSTLEIKQTFFFFFLGI